jgi:hypothetical protein
MTRVDKIKLVQLAYKAAGYNFRLHPSGVIDQETFKAVIQRRNSLLDRDFANLLILAHMNLGLNTNLVADGTAGEELYKAEDSFLALYDQPEPDESEPLFLGVEHVALYTHGVDAQTTADWYAETFGFLQSPGNSSIMLGIPSGNGRIEVIRKTSDAEVFMIAHVAIAVSDFDAAVASLEERGHKVNSTTLVEKPGLKAVWLMELDPLGNGVHIIWRQ